MADEQPKEETNDEILTRGTPQEKRVCKRLYQVLEACDQVVGGIDGMNIAVDVCLNTVGQAIKKREGT